MGTRVDERHRNHLRNDTDRLQYNILKAREFIFVQGIGVTGKSVDRLLGEISCVPIQVCSLYYKPFTVLTPSQNLECIFNTAV